MQFENDTESIDLRGYLSIFRRRKWTIIIAICVILGAAVAYSLIQTPLYTAQTRILVSGTPTEGIFTTGIAPVENANLKTQVEVILSEAVASRVMEDLDLEGEVGSVLSNVAAEPILDSQVVEITYSSADPQEARIVATSFAESYLQFRRDQILETVISEEQAIQERVNAASDQLAEANLALEEARESEDAALISTIESSVSSLVARLGVLQQELDDLRSRRSQRLDVGQVIEPAATPRTPSSPNFMRNALIGIFLGLVLGIAFAFVRERMDERFRERSDLERAIGAPVLATVAGYDNPRTGPVVPVVLSGAHPSVAESYRTLRTGVQFIAANSGIRSLLVTSPAAGEGKTTTAANLAVALAQAGKRVIIVSSDLRRPTLERYFGSEDARRTSGLAMWLSSQEDEPWDHLVDPGIPNLRLITSGPPPPNPAELLTSPRLNRLVHLLEENSDLVIFDSPPVLAVADTTVLAAHLSGVLLVVDAKSTRRSPAIHAKQELERVGGRIIGTVLNAFDTTTVGYYYGSYDYYSREEAAEAAPSSTNGQAHESKGLRRLRPRARR